jgi:Protein of unknown function (DUF2628)
MSDFDGMKLRQLYKAAIGEKNQGYYLAKFELFDQGGPGFHPSWNWPAFFFTGFWALYRRMYGWFFAWWGLAIVGNLFKNISSENFQTALSVVLISAWLGFGVFANSMYHKKIKAKIARENKLSSRERDLLSGLRKKGGILSWVLFVGIGIPLIGVVAAVVLPAYKDYSKRQLAAALPENGAQPPTVNEVDTVKSKNSEMPREVDADTQKSTSVQKIARVDEGQQLDRQILLEQGIGGNQSLEDWGDAQLSARLFDDSSFRKARSFVLMWQRQIVLNLKYSPERALFLSYNIVLNQYDSDKLLCRPDMSNRGGVENLPDETFKIHPECLVKK